MHNFSPTSPVLGDPLQLFPAQPHLLDICLKVLPDVPVANLVHPSCIPKIFRKHCFTNVWALFSVVLLIRHASAPYSNIDLTFVLNRRFFVVLPIILDFHTFLKMWNAALLILVFTSASSPLSLLVCPLHTQIYI